jgi:hypothetical protein
MGTAIGRHPAWLALLTLLLAAPGAVFAQGRTSGAILGRVTEAGTDRPIGGATVAARHAETPSEPGEDATALTASDGIFFLSPLRPGPHTITATFGGYDTASIAGYPVRASDPNRAMPGPALFALSRPAGGATARSDEGPAPRSDAHLEARVRWETRGDGARSGEPLTHPPLTGDRFVVVEIHRYPGERPRQRAPELSEEQVLVVGTDRRGTPRDGSLIPDPGLLRAEAPGPDGALTGETRRLAGTEFLVIMPADPEIVTLRFYRPRWTGALFALELLGTADFPAPPAASGQPTGTLTPSPDR